MKWLIFVFTAVASTAVAHADSIRLSCQRADEHIDISIVDRVATLKIGHANSLTVHQAYLKTTDGNWSSTFVDNQGQTSLTLYNYIVDGGEAQVVINGHDYSCMVVE